MKKLLLVISYLIFTLQIFANTDALSKAETLYTNQEYDSVITIYNSLIQEGTVSAQLYYNLGNAYYKQNELAKAILYYEKAFLLAPNDEDIIHNLGFAHQQQIDEIKVITTGFVGIWLKDIYRTFSVDTWAVLSVFFFLLFIVSLYFFLFAKSIKLKKLGFFIGIFLLISTILFALAANARHAELTNNKYAIVVEPTTSLKTEPSESAQDLTVVHGGLKVEVISTVGEWTSIKLADGKQAWVLSEYIEKI